jgi:hypothetical protein
MQAFDLTAFSCETDLQKEAMNVYHLFRSSLGRSSVKIFVSPHVVGDRSAPRQIPLPRPCPGGAAHRRVARSVMARLVTDQEGADYIGLPLATFRAWVEIGRLPKPIPDVDKFDIKALDQAIDGISGLDTPANALDAWRETKESKRAR